MVHSVGPLEGLGKEEKLLLKCTKYYGHFLCIDALVNDNSFPFVIAVHCFYGLFFKGMYCMSPGPYEFPSLIGHAAR